MVDMVFGWLVHPDECQSPTNTEKSSSLLKVFHQVTVGTSGMGKSMNKTRHMGPHLSNELTAENRSTISTQTLVFFSLDVSGSYNQISRQV